MAQPSDMKREMPTSAGIARKLVSENARAAKRTLGPELGPRITAHLKVLGRDYGFSIEAGELQIINGNWYVTHTGLVRLPAASGVAALWAISRRCSGESAAALASPPFLAPSFDKATACGFFFFSPMALKSIYASFGRGKQQQVSCLTCLHEQAYACSCRH